MKEIKIWVTNQKTKYWTPEGEVELPERFEFLESGNRGLTQRVKEGSEQVFVLCEKEGKYTRVKGIFASKEVIEAAKASEPSEEEKERGRQARSRRKARDQAKAIAEATEEIKKLFPSIPVEEANTIAAEAFEIGSGRVGRSTKVEDPYTLAVIAYIRHNYTRYDELLQNNITKSEARFFVKEEINQILEKWRKERKYEI